MSRKDFNLIAKTIEVVRRTATTPEAVTALHQLTYAMTSALAETNPRFDGARFIRACGFSSEVR